MVGHILQRNGLFCKSSFLYNLHSEKSILEIANSLINLSLRPFHHLIHITIIKNLVNYTDEDLLILLKKGDRDAFNCIYNRYWKGLFFCALKKLGEKEEAEDLIQDLFVSIWTKREDFEISSSLKAYLFTALKYKIINHFEFKKVRRKHLATLKDAFSELDNGTSNTLLAEEVEKRVEVGINKLSPKVKLVYQLSRDENLSLDEIAERLEVSKQTVKNQISKALKVLKAHLNHSYLWIIFATFIYLMFS